MASILIVDDEPTARILFKEMLAGRSHDIRVAENGDEAIAACREKPADLLITDLVMPKKNGIDLILELKKDHPDIRIIAVSGGGGISGRFEYLPIAKMIGARTVLNKPFSAQVLRDAVDQALAN
ncbi:MAG: response regulator [Gammaproteobacteria bacterium]|nr:response regulator [Gammaproteobacteria bacterium]